MSTTMEKTTNTCDCDREGEVLFPQLDSAKKLLEATTAVKLGLKNQNFDALICTLERYLSANNIKALSCSVADILDRINRVKVNELSREEFATTLSIFIVALNSFIREEEERKLDIFAIRRVGKMLYSDPEAFYNAVFGKRE